MSQPESATGVQGQNASMFAPQGEPFEVATPIVLPGLDRVLIADLTEDPNWLLVENGFTLAREHEVESLFSIANGYIGNRGSLAEGSLLSAPATFLAGVFEKPEKPGSVPGLFPLPDWTGIRAWIEGQPLTMEQGEILQHRRVLDMRRAILWRLWRHRDVNGRVTRLIASRLASLAHRHMLVQSVVITPENYTGQIGLEMTIELPPDVVASAPPEEWKARRNATRPNILPLGLRSPGTNISIAIAAASQLFAHDQNACTRQIDIGDRRITESFRVDAEIGAEYRLDRVVSMYTSRDTADPIEEAVTQVHGVLAVGAKAAVEDHINAWESRWRASDVEVEGDPDLQKSLRFAEYHLISAANPEDPEVSVGARALTGESYKGHVFWDTEIYMLPFYTLTDPASARALLMYRHYALPAAREKAKAAGYRGAMYPWESADNGEETTPRFVIDPKGAVIEVLNGDMEVHITADVAYSVWQYWDATGDDDFFLRAGAEIMLETARFWASRGEVEADGMYHIRHVIGPDEYHENVDDSAFTNLMACWNLRRGVETAATVQHRWPDSWKQLSQRLSLTAEETTTWSKLADITYTGFNADTKLFEQFHGYYEKEVVDLKSYEPRHAAMDVILGHERIQSTNVVKQADVVMAMYLLWGQFPAEVRLENFHFYEPRTGHGSSLSPSMHALIAARLRDLAVAERYLRQAAEIDLGNNMGNAAGGVHAAAIGGLWQALVFGFGGLQLRDDGLSLSPVLLPHWHCLSFPLQWRGRKLRITASPSELSVSLEEDGPEMKLYVDGGSSIAVAKPHREYRVLRQEDRWGEWQRV